MNITFGLSKQRWILRLGAGVFLTATLASVDAAATDYALSRHKDDWLRHPVYGDPSFDAFERVPGNPVHRGAPPFEWPVNGFLFEDPVSANWYLYVGDYGRGYLQPPSRCILYRSTDSGNSWTNLGVVLQGDGRMFDRAGHTPDVSVVYADRRYHMVYDWGEPNFQMEGGLAYAWADHPEGPWHRAADPITRNSALTKLLGRYQRTYAATLLRRRHDWLILGMMDYAPQGWALFAMTAPTPEGPWSERRLVRHVEADYYHPPLMEFFPAFSHQGYVYAPATSVALNRNFNAVFRAALERAHEPAAWSLWQHGSAWHAEDVEHEFFGIWGQTFSSAVDKRGVLHAMFPSRDSQGRGTINLAQRSWKRPLRSSGFVLTGHAGPSMTLLRQAYCDFRLDAELSVHGKAEILLDYAVPLNPHAPASDATLHPMMRTRQAALELAPGACRLLQRDVNGNETEIGKASLVLSDSVVVRISRRSKVLSTAVNGQELWTGALPMSSGFAPTGVIGLRVETNTHMWVEKFNIEGQVRTGVMRFGANEALLGAAESASDWTGLNDPMFHYGIGSVSKNAAARVKWNVIGNRLRLWSPRGPEFGKAELQLDGRMVATLDLHSEQVESSRVVWESRVLKDDYHALVLTTHLGRMPVDCLEVLTGRGRRN